MQAFGDENWERILFYTYMYELFPCTPGRQLIIDTITKLGPAIEATLGWGTSVKNNIKFYIGEIHYPHFNVYLNNFKQKSKYSSKISF